MVTNMIVELQAVSFDPEREKMALADAGITLTNGQGATAQEQAWIRRTFNATWSKEASQAWNWFAWDDAGKLAGFASYEQRHYRWWWLRNWLKQPDVGIFGPVGVAPAMRGKKLGAILTLRALASMRALGYKRAVIPRVGPKEFYERCCGARIADTVRLFGIF